MARRMVDAGYEVHIITSIRESSKRPADWLLTEEAGIQVHWYPVPYSNHMSFSQRIKAFFSFARAAQRKAMELEGNVVFATSTPLTIALPAVRVARAKNIPMVFEVRDLWPELPIAMGALRNPFLRFGAKLLERWAYHNSQSVVALSPGMKEGVVKTGYPASKVAVIPNSSDNKDFFYGIEGVDNFRKKRDWLGDRPLLVYTGTFGKINGVDYMVELAKELLSLGSDIRILLVGDGAEREAIKDLALKKGVYQNNLFIENPLPKRDMPSVLAAATMASVLFIDLPQMRPNSANKFFDSLASGTPVMLNFGGWMHELVNIHGCGLSLWNKPIKSVAFEVDRKMHDEHWLEESGKSARALAEARFDRDQLASQLISVLQNAVVGSPQEAAEIAPGNYSVDRS
jgi:glycosyltransferase involved in cell wall biosynthesis